MEQCTKCGGSGLSEPVTADTLPSACASCHGSGKDTTNYSGVLLSAKQLLEQGVQEKMNKLRSVGVIR